MAKIGIGGSETPKTKKQLIVGTDSIDPKGLMGVILSWGLKHADEGYDMETVEKALRDNGLPTEVMPSLGDIEFFLRGIKKLCAVRKGYRVPKKTADHIVVHIVKAAAEDDDEILKDATVIYDKEKNEMRCKDKAVKALLEEKINLASLNYGTGDISKMLVKLFGGDNADFIPIKPRGGCYFVPIKFLEWIRKIERFLKTLSKVNYVRAFPVPSSESAREQTTDALIEEMNARKAEMLAEFDRLIENKGGISDREVKGREQKIAANRAYVERMASLCKLEGEEALAICDNIEKELIRRREEAVEDKPKKKKKG